MQSPSGEQAPLLEERDRCRGRSCVFELSEHRQGLFEMMLVIQRLRKINAQLVILRLKLDSLSVAIGHLAEPVRGPQDHRPSLMDPWVARDQDLELVTDGQRLVV